VLEDKVLLWKLKRGDANAMHYVYEKYKRDMLGLAISLSRDRATGEDIVHDVFVSFVRISPKLKLRTSLRSYLLSSVANRVRNMGRIKPMEALPGERKENSGIHPLPPDCIAIAQEQDDLVDNAMAQLPYDQREIITLHIQGKMKFREIAASQITSINTVQSRYRYGLEKLRTLLDGKVTP
jgi:RNA polymerase sigma-70 factor, ECF subfamily